MLQYGIRSAGAEQGQVHRRKERTTVRRARGFVLGLGLAFGLALGALPLVADEAAAQDINLEGENCVIGILCATSEAESGEGGDATARGGHGGNGGTASVSNVGNAHAAAASSVILGDITTHDAFGHSIFVDARGGEDPSSIAGSFSDTDVDVFAPGGSVQAGTTGGYGINADASGGHGGDATATGGNSGEAESCAAGLLGCFDTLILIP
jgi:hypothetical protein